MWDTQHIPLRFQAILPLTVGIATLYLWTWRVVYVCPVILYRFLRKKIVNFPLNCV